MNNRLETLSQSYAADEVRRKVAIDDLRESVARAERRINEIVSDLHKETGLIVEIKPAIGSYRTYAGQGDSVLGVFPSSFQKFPQYQEVYQVVAKITA